MSQMDTLGQPTIMVEKKEKFHREFSGGRLVVNDKGVPSKRAGSWKSMPTFRRRPSTSRSQISRPSKNTVPKGGSHRRFSALNSVDFPLPLGPMTPTISPFGMSTLIPFSIGTPASDFFLRSRIRNFVWVSSGRGSSTSTTSRCSCASSAQKKKKKKQNQR
jgi:hypothetical protein